ncbi:MAG TPA: hypothetical protein VI074_04945 [Propionibacteriaceae bacterium]
MPGQQRCVATANNKSAVLDLDQAHFASIIAGVAVRRGLPPRAASIALATAYQETGIRNLDYGDRDSVGLFQQRPSQGWGTKQQLMDPDYAAGKFYDALVKIKDWQTDDINDVAQKVQRSGHPEAYNDHEADARVLASALTGQSPAGFSCLDRSGTAGDVKGLRRSMQRTFGNIDDSADGSVITIRTQSDRRAWAYAHYAVANAALYGVTTVKIADRAWQTQDFNLPDWQEASPTFKNDRVEITVRQPPQ